MKNYALFVLVGGESIFHGVVGHKASRILCGEGRKYEPLKLFKWFPHCLCLGARLDLFQHTKKNVQCLKLCIDREMICEGLLGQHMVTNWRRAWNYRLFIQDQKMFLYQDTQSCFFWHLLLVSWYCDVKTWALLTQRSPNNGSTMLPWCVILDSMAAFKKQKRRDGHDNSVCL